MSSALTEDGADIVIRSAVPASLSAVAAELEDLGRIVELLDLDCCLASRFLASPGL